MNIIVISSFMFDHFQKIFSNEKEKILLIKQQKQNDVKISHLIRPSQLKT